MHRTDAAGATGDHLFTNGDPASGTPCTLVDADWLNALQESVCQVIEGAEITLVKGDNTQLLDAIMAIIASALSTTWPGVPVAASGGTVDAITATFAPAIALTDKRIVAVRASGANTSTAPTFAPNGLTAHAIVKQGGQALAAGNIPRAAYVMLLMYDLANTRWELLNSVEAAAVTTLEQFLMYS